MLDQDRYWDCLDQAQEASSGGRTEEALAWLDEALRANPKGAEAHNGRGEILWDAGRHEEALAEFDRAVAANPEFYPAHLNRIEIMVEEFQENDEAFDLADDLLGGSLERGTEAEVYYLKAKALFYLDDLERGRCSCCAGPCRPTARSGGAIAASRGRSSSRWGASRRPVRASSGPAPWSRRAPTRSTTWGSSTSTRASRTRRKGCSSRRPSWPPDQYPLAVRMDSHEFEAAAESALETAAIRPSQVRPKNCPILIESLPDAELVQSESVSPQVLGLFVGGAHSVPEKIPWSTESVSEPTRILLFKPQPGEGGPVARAAVEQIQITVKHEIGHYLGLDEDELDRLGLG